MKFSDRIGATKPENVFQNNSMERTLKDRLYNVFLTNLLNKVSTSFFIGTSVYESMIINIWDGFLKRNLEDMPRETFHIKLEFNNFYKNLEWYEVYNFIEYVANVKEHSFHNQRFIDDCNKTLKEEVSGYRFIDNKLVPITEEHEIKSIENAIIESDKLGLKGVKIHLSEALAKLSDKKNPDYRNSIKESISAVESICQVISGDPNTELGTALKKMRTVVPIHRALEQGFKNLYGYTSNGDGIRHSLMDEPNLDQEDAVYMLVTCSAFVNYLIVKASKAGLIKAK